jgi:Spy/CpxP family protein refolding chaperone
MKENLKKVLFIASIALNVVFAATYVAYKLPWLTGAHQPAPGVPIFLQLDLTPDQLKQFSAERDSFHARLQELRQEIKTKQIELIDILGAASPDQKEIKKKQKEIQRLQEAVQDRVIVHFLHASEFLTPEQRSRFFELIKARIETGIQACPPWMRSIGQGKPGENDNE